MRAQYSMLVLAAIALPAFTMVAGGKESTPKNHRPYVTITGAESKILKTEYRCLHTQDQLISLWRKHMGNTKTGPYSMHYNKLNVPKVDFKQCQVVAIFQGACINSAGLTAISMTEEKERVLLRFDDKSYQTMNGATKASPYAFFVIPNIHKKVVLEENVQGLLNQPPIWKQRIEFGQTSKIISLPGEIPK